MEELIMDYEAKFKAYQMGIYTEKEWHEYCVEVLVKLMEINKDVLERLKNFNTTY